MMKGGLFFVPLQAEFGRGGPFSGSEGERGPLCIRVWRGFSSGHGVTCGQWTGVNCNRAIDAQPMY